MGFYFEDKAWDTYYYDDSTWWYSSFDKYYDQSILFYTISGIFNIVGIIMVFVLTGIILNIHRFKMKEVSKIELYDNYI